MRHPIARAALLTLAAALTPIPAALAQIETVRLDDSPFSLGTLGAEEGALPQDLWRGADAETLRPLLAAVPDGFGEPALTDLARRVLLSPGTAPVDADEALAGAKLLAASRAGFYREAAELAALAPALRNEPALAEVVATAALLDGDVTAACRQGATLAAGRTEAFWLKLRFLCYAANDEQAAADLTLGLLRDRGVLTPSDERAFDALIAGGSLGSSVSPEGTFQYAAARMLGADVTEAAVPELPGAVLAAVARDTNAPQDLRALALTRAVAEGLIGREEGLSLTQGLAASDLTADIVSVLTTSADAPDRQAAVITALTGATDWPAFKARAVLLGPAIRAVRLPAVAGPDAGADTDTGAGALALGAAVIGETEAAARFAQAAASVGEPPLGTALLVLLRTDTVAPGTLGAGTDAESDLAAIVSGALDAAGSRSAGAAALAALAAAGALADSEADAVRQVVVARMLERSGVGEEVAMALAIDREGPALLAQLSGEAVIEERDPAPRLKPRQ